MSWYKQKMQNLQQENDKGLSEDRKKVLSPFLERNTENYKDINSP